MCDPGLDGLSSDRLTGISASLEMGTYSLWYLCYYDVAHTYTLIVDDVFLQNVCSMFDYANTRVGFVELALCNTWMHRLIPEVHVHLFVLRTLTVVRSLDGL